MALSASETRRVIVVSLLVGIPAVAWWLFGFSTTRGRGWTLRTQRYFGRVVRADLDSNGDRKPEDSLLFSWRQPMRHHQPPTAILSDRDQDGRWDLWIVRGGRDAEGFPLATFKVDTDRDGKPDWTFVDHWQSTHTYDKIRARRGF